MSEEFELVRTRVARLVPEVGDYRTQFQDCLAVDSPPAALTLARRAAEALAKQILRDLGQSEAPMLEACLRRLEEPAVMSRGLVPAEIVSLLHAARVLGNKSAHAAPGIDIGRGDVALVLGLLLRILEWYFVEFARCPPERKLIAIYAPGSAVPVGMRAATVPVLLGQLETEEGEGAELREGGREVLAREWVAAPPSRRRELDVKLSGSQTVRARARDGIPTQELIWDLQAELRLLSIHREYVRLLNEDIALEAASRQRPGLVIERNSRLTEIAQARRRVTEYLDALLESVELIIPRQG